MQGKEVGAMHNQSDESPNAFSGAPPEPLLASMNPPSLSASPLAASGPFTTPPSSAATITPSLSEAKALTRASTLSSTQCARSSRMAWGDGGVEIEVGIHVPEMAEDARKGAPEQGAPPLLHQPVSPDRPRLQLCHHVSEELKIASIVDCVRLANSRLADVAQGYVGSLLERGEHGAVLMLQDLPLMYLVRILARDDLGLLHPLAEKEHLGLGGG